MKIDELIERLNLLKDKVGGDKEIVFVNCEGENDVFTPDYPVIGDFHDCDNTEYKCAIMISMIGDEFTNRDIPHYKWNPKEDKIGD